MTAQSSGLVGLILCGGAGLRVGGADKPLIHWQGQRLLDHVIERLEPQVSRLLISANRNHAVYERRAPVIADRWGDYQGPLAGVTSALMQLQEQDPQPQRRYLVCPGDMPHLPTNLVQGLAAEYQFGRPSYVHDGKRSQPLCLLCDESILPNLLAYLRSGQRSAIGWLTQCDAHPVSFPDPGAFTNLNTLAELDASG